MIIIFIYLFFDSETQIIDIKNVFIMPKVGIEQWCTYIEGRWGHSHK